MNQSQTYDSGPGGKRRMKLIWIVIIIIGLMSLFTASAELITDWLWFKHDAMHPEVFLAAFKTRSVLWIATFAVVFLTISYNILATTKSEVLYISQPSNEAQKSAAAALQVFRQAGRLIAGLAGLVLGLGIASSVAGDYESYWLFTAGGEFGRVDPIFNLDLGFFVFKLPFLSSVVGKLAFVAATAAVLTLVGYLGTKNLAKVAGAEIKRKDFRVHASVLSGIALILIGASLFVGRYEVGVTYGDLYSGPGYAAIIQLQITTAISILAVLMGLAVIANGFVGTPWKVASKVLPIVAILAFLASAIVPSAVQAWVVKPNGIKLETPYVQRAIDQTRFGYGLDVIETKDFSVQLEPTRQEVQDASNTLANMRLWDPFILNKVIDNIQTLRPYYQFYDVDTDRYTIDGRQQMVMIAPRDIDFGGVNPSSQSWMTRHMVYSHGNGVVMARVNGADAGGRPNFEMKNLPAEAGSEDFIADQQRLYFSSYPDNTYGAHDYLIIPTDQEEFDAPGTEGADSTYKWSADRGVPFGSPMVRLIYSMIVGDFVSLMTSDAITEKSRIVYRRDVSDRAEAVFPMLTLDSDPYIVVDGERLVWMIDAYTTSDQIPYSRTHQLDGHLVNYIRNSVKITVDAYSGEMNAYAFDESDPILKAIRKLFPNLIQDRSELPASLLSHIRAAEDGFEIQANVLTEYHVTDPRAFITNEDAWEIPDSRRSGADIRPYYVQMRLPDEDEDGFQLILPFTPREKKNMIGWLSAQCDPDNYGKMALYKFPKNSQTQGPAQMEGKFTADKEIADINRQFNNDQSKIVVGNLLIIPIGSSILYVRPMFLESKSQPIPELKKVALGLQNRVVVADTYEDALDKLFGEQAPVVETPDDPVDPVDPVDTAKPAEPTEEPATVDVAGVREALRLFDQADQALRDGDFARYGELQKKARAALEGLTE